MPGSPPSSVMSAFTMADPRLLAAYVSIQDLLQVPTRQPKIGIVCGSGLGGLANQLEESETISYQSIDQWPRLKTDSVVKGHETKGLVFGKLGKTEVVCQSGRWISIRFSLCVMDVISSLQLRVGVGHVCIMCRPLEVDTPSLALFNQSWLNDFLSSSVVGTGYTAMSESWNRLWFLKRIASCLLFTNWRIVFYLGRAHHRRGYPLIDVIFAVRMFKLLGCEAVICKSSGPIRTCFYSLAARAPLGIYLCPTLVQICTTIEHQWPTLLVRSIQTSKWDRSLLYTIILPYPPW